MKKKLARAAAFLALPVLLGGCVGELVSGVSALLELAMAVIGMVGGPVMAYYLYRETQD